MNTAACGSQQSAPRSPAPRDDGVDRRRPAARRAALLAALLLSAVVLGSCGSKLPSPRPLPSGITCTGEWDTNWGQMSLTQRGKHVHGRYKGFRNGSITGDIEGNLLVFKWTQVKPRLHGRGYLVMSSDGKRLEGRWGYLKERFGGGRWWANRIENY